MLQVSFLPGSPWGARTHELPGVCRKQAAERCSEELRVQHGQVLGPSRADRVESASLANPPEPLMLLLLGPSGRYTGLVVLQEHWVGTEAGRQISEVTKVKQEPPQLSCLVSGRLPPRASSGLPLALPGFSTGKPWNYILVGETPLITGAIGPSFLQGSWRVERSQMGRRNKASEDAETP